MVIMAAADMAIMGITEGNAQLLNGSMAQSYKKARQWKLPRFFDGCTDPGR
jgi:hypothetical protein